VVELRALAAPLLDDLVNAVVFVHGRNFIVPRTCVLGRYVLGCNPCSPHFSIDAAIRSAIPSS